MEPLAQLSCYDEFQKTSPGKEIFLLNKDDFLTHLTQKGERHKEVCMGIA